MKKKTIKYDFSNHIKIHIRTEADMEKLWDVFGTEFFHLGDRKIILVEYKGYKNEKNKSY